MNNQKSLLWTFKMAWRDSRSNRSKLFLFMAAIIVGVAAQVAITSFRANLNTSIESQAKELLGADLEVERNAPFQEELQAVLDSLGGEVSTALEFNSMAFFPKTGTTRLSQISAVEGGFPFYGDLITEPASAAQTFQQNGGALVDEPVMRLFDLQPGDSVKIGQITYKIEGTLIEIPGQPVAASFFGPRIFIPKENVEETGLLQRGSRLEYVSWHKFPEGTDMAYVDDRLDQLRDQQNLRFGYDTVDEREEEVGEAILYLSNFLNLIGFIALLLGGIGVASSIFVYIRQKIDTVAVLRCVGVSSNQALLIYLIQAAAMGLTGSVLGAALGSIIQLYLPVLVQDFLPVDIDLYISWFSIAIGIGTGLAISILFALFPLLAVKKISPLFTLRSISINLIELLTNNTKAILSFILLIFVTGYAWLMIGEFLPALFFTLGLVACLALLTGFAKLIMKGSRKFLRAGFSYELRQGLANLYRPNNQTTTLLLTFGLGVTMISSLYLTQDMLLDQIDFGDQEDLPNLALYDIQYDQNEGVNEIITSNGHEILQNVPIVTMRLQSINGETTEEIDADTTRDVSGWALNREYRSTYRDSLLPTETLVEGEWIGQAGMNEIVPVSIEADQMDNLDASIGDTLTWDVQGIPIQSYIASTRTVTWDQPSPNFFVVFPSGVLENAPQFFATTIKTQSREASLRLQQELVQEYPNVSAIDVGQVLDTVRNFLDKVTFVIQFIGLFSIITGLIVLAGSAATSRFQRIREAVLLRTLGASKRQVIKIQVIEYVLLGVMASLTGLILSLGASYLIGYFYFDIQFVPDFFIIGAEILILTALVLLIGLLNTRGVHNKPPLEVLRAEVV
ncbi:ABC transporter permease [Gracilimonas mengyeensis]|uniref:Putative ABC transport system permease protein n=1 Tax=Gracilimonas mengyeensis TaxID=1302730 RepID=A0A521E1T3_9BACT|nr:FtsX-like permease family protein [Gracilimonas mengyeensis]SMO77898.1 putative ABC transport system permease protein [Gracilimonas mengyeensis]